MRRCLNCFAEYPDVYSVCPVCGNSVGCLTSDGNGLKPGTVLRQRYITGKIAGVGGFGIVYKAFDENLKRTVAVKEFFCTGLSERAEDGIEAGPKDTRDSAEYLTRKRNFLAEARFISSLGNCDGVVKVNDYFEDNGTAYIVMEYLNGRPLSSYISKEGCDADFAVYATYAAAVAVRGLHINGKVHRDLAPDNIFVCTEGEGIGIRLLDFGAALNEGRKTDNKDIVLKPGFSPPEQYLPGKVSKSADVYSLGATLYTLLSGQSPADPAENRRYKTTDFPEAKRNRIPKRLLELINLATDSKAEKRFRDAGEFAAELKKCAAAMKIKLPEPKPQGKIPDVKIAKAVAEEPEIRDISEERGCSLPLPARLLPGTLLKSRYAVGLDYRRAGSCAVYTARDTVLYRTVSISEFFPSGLVFRDGDGISLRSVSADSEYAEKLAVFRQNAGRYLALGENPGCEYFDDCFEENGTYYLVSATAGLRPLSEFIEANGRRRFTEAETRKLLRPIARALLFLEKSGMCHGNISPATVYTDGERTVLRFPSMLCFTPKSGIKAAGALYSRYWSAPELAYGSRTSAESDAYSLGALAYYLLSGQVPSDGCDRASCFLSTGKDPLTERGRWSTKLSLKLNRAILAALATVPGGRKALINELENDS